MEENGMTKNAYAFGLCFWSGAVLTAVSLFGPSGVRGAYAALSCGCFCFCAFVLWRHVVRHWIAYMGMRNMLLRDVRAGIKATQMMIDHPELAAGVVEELGMEVSEDNDENVKIVSDRLRANVEAQEKMIEALHEYRDGIASNVEALKAGLAFEGIV